MIRSVIIDDESSARETLRAILSKYFPEIQVVGEADSVETAVALIKKENPQLVFLDVKMKFGTGFDVLDRIGKIDFEVIFITAYDNYALQAFRFSAMDYLLKPIKIKELREALEKVRKSIQLLTGPFPFRILESPGDKERNQNSKIVIPTTNGFQVVKLAEIIRGQGQRNYTDIFLLNDKKLTVPRTLKDFEQLLEEMGFLRVHKSHLINLEHVCAYTRGKGGEVIMVDDASIPVSRDQRKTFVSRFLNLG